MNADRLSSLNAREKHELQSIQEHWSRARRERDYSTADKLRADLENWGCSSPNYLEWHPVFESKEHRLYRAALRYVYGEP